MDYRNIITPEPGKRSGNRFSFAADRERRVTVNTE